MQEKTLTGGRSYYLDIARTIAIISISLNHAVNRTYDNYFGQMEEFLESSYLSSLLKSVVTVFSHLGVPLFLMISGALLPAQAHGDCRRRETVLPPQSAGAVHHGGDLVLHHVLVHLL